MTESDFIPRKCRELKLEGTDEVKPLEAYDDVHCYVLFGDSGSGKTELFKREADRTRATYIEVEYGDALENLNSSEPVLYLDGLDEIRESHALKEALKKARELKVEKLRIACRASAWSIIFQKDITSIFGSQPIYLQLENFNLEEVRHFLRQKLKTETEIDNFIEHVFQHDLWPFCENPQLLNLLILAVKNEWPRDKIQLFKIACDALLKESNSRHRELSGRKNLSSEKEKAIVGFLFTLIVLVDLAGFTLDPDGEDDHYFLIKNIPFNGLLNLPEPEMEAVRHMLGTNLFTRGRPDQRRPTHRTVAEFLAAQYLLGPLKDSPLIKRRLFASMKNDRGKFLPYLIGLCVWLALLSPDLRKELIPSLPLAISTEVVDSFTEKDIEELLMSLRNFFQSSNEDFGFYLNYLEFKQKSFKALGAKKYENTLISWMNSDERNQATQAVLQVVIYAMTYGELTCTQNILEKMGFIAKDSSYLDALRIAAVNILSQERQYKTLEDVSVLVAQEGNQAVLHALNKGRLQELPLAISPTIQEVSMEVGILTDEAKKNVGALVEYCEKNLELIASGMAPPNVYYYISHIEAGRWYTTLADSGEARLNQFFEAYKTLKCPILSGLKNILTRKDMPDAKSIFKIKVENKLYPLMDPCLLSLKLNEDLILQLSSDEQSRMVAFYLVSEDYSEPKWISDLIQALPDFMAAIYGQYLKQMLEAGREDIKWLWSNQRDHSAFLLLLLPNILKFFPLRAAKKLSETILSSLLKTALDVLPSELLLILLKDRLFKKGLVEEQKVYWLTSGLFLTPENFIDALNAYLKNSQTKKQDFAKFLVKIDFSCYLRMNIHAKLLILENLASTCQIEIPKGHGVYEVTFDHQVRLLLEELIEQLLLTDEGCQALEILSQNGSFGRWNAFIQEKLSKEKEIIKPLERIDIFKICEILKNKNPINHTDLIELVCGSLDAIQIEISQGNSNAWKTYWDFKTEDHKRIKQNPKPETECRDILLNSLKSYLSGYGVHAEPEGRHAQEKDSDIKIIFSPSNLIIPVEIKRIQHSEVWRAWKSQLPFYTADPGADGYGIYLVLWFGKDYVKASPPNGVKPTTAAECENFLFDLIKENSLTPKMRVYVLDCQPI